jgi:hypothetical protein
MKQLIYTIITGLVILSLASCGDEIDTETAENVLAAAPGYTDVILDNDYVQVIEVDLDDGDRIPTHEADGHIEYALSSYEVEIRHGEEKTTETFGTGSVRWRDDGTYAVKNTGDTDAKYLIISRKETDLPEYDPEILNQDVSTMQNINSANLLDNEHVRAVEIILNPGEMLGGHSCANRILYSLTDFEATYRPSQLERFDTTFTANGLNWYEAGAHSLHNIGKTPAHFVVFEFID